MNGKKICTTCHGNGYVYIDSAKTKTKTCETCRGQGEVKK